MNNRTASKRKAVLKDFGDLRPVEHRIELVASGIYQIVFKGEVNEDFMPKRGTEVFRVWKMCKLDERQQIAWQAFMDDINLAEGKSGGVCGGYGEYSDKGNGNEFRVPVAYANVHLRRLERLLMEFLNRRERALIVDLVQDALKGNGSFQLETVGLVRSGYADKVSARAAGVVHTQILLDRLADYYGV